MAVAEAPTDAAPNREDEFVAAEPLDTEQKFNKDGTPRKKMGRPVGSKNRGPGAPRSRGSLEAQIGGLLFTFNIPLSLIPPLQKDALDNVEIAALAKAIDQECQRNSTFRKYVESALKVQGATSLFSVVSLIGARRLVRHEIIPIPEAMGGPSGVDASLGSLISAVSGQGLFDPNLFKMKQTDEAVVE